VSLENQNSFLKKYMPLAIKITVIALAVAILLTVVAVVVALTSDAPSRNDPMGNVFSNDKEAPEIQGPEGDAAVAYIGETIAYKSFVKVTDDSGKYKLNVNTDKVNKSREGTYTVTYTATDEAGNETKYNLKLTLKKKLYSEATLMELVEEKAKMLGLSKDMSKAELVRKIYDYVNSPSKSKDNANIYFNDESNTPAQQESRGTWETDWIEEAVRTLQMERMKGDCYTYYAVSKAFFEYFEIENLGIQRSADADEAGTHFWNVVNVGTESKPKWYYYDATRLAGTFSSDGSRNGCLMTEGKLNSYRTSKGGTEFYKFEKPSDFPQIANAAVTD
jgi:hypothetical protein